MRGYFNCSVMSGFVLVWEEETWGSCCKNN